MGDIRMYPRGTGAPQARYNATLGIDVVPGQVNTLRFRNTIAEINAGKTLLPAIGNLGIKVLDAVAIAYGGAVGATTTVDLLGTSGTSRKLVAWAQANLTQSTVLRAGGTGATVLADGASFTVNDDNTAVTIGKTGSSLTTATGVDVIVTFVYE